MQEIENRKHNSTPFIERLRANLVLLITQRSVLGMPVLLPVLLLVVLLALLQMLIGW